MGTRRAGIEPIPHLNPPADRLGLINAVMGSAGRGSHHVSDFAGPLSIKFMVRGSGVWRSDAGVHHVEEGYFLILNHGQTYFPRHRQRSAPGILLSFLPARLRGRRAPHPHHSQ